MNIDNNINIENIEGDLTPFLIYDKYLDKLGKKITASKPHEINWLYCYEKIFKNWIKNVNFEDVQRRIGFIKYNLSKTLNKLQIKYLDNNNNKNNFISQQIYNKFKYEIKKYNYVKSVDDLNKIKNEEEIKQKKFKIDYQKIFEKKKVKRNSVQMVDKLKIDFNKNTSEFEKYKNNNKNFRKKNISHRFSVDNITSSTNYSKSVNKNSNSTFYNNNNKELNNFNKINNYYSNRINLERKSTVFEYPKKIIIKDKENLINNNLYYIENSNFKKIKIQLKDNLLLKNNTKIKPYFLDEINILHQLQLNDFMAGGIKSYKSEKYYQLFNFQNLYLDQNFEDSIDNDKQILDSKKICDEIMRIYNSKILMGNHLLDLEKYD